jgi:hypothetical protein
MVTSQRPVYLVVYNNRVFLAHWALWIPSHDTGADKAGNVGKIIHVQGDARSGFNHEFKRNYDMSVTTRTKEILLLGSTNSKNVVDGTYTGPVVLDNTATDVIEQWALYIPAPGPSLRSVNYSVRGYKFDALDIIGSHIYI